MRISPKFVLAGLAGTILTVASLDAAFALSGPASSPAAATRVHAVSAPPTTAVHHQTVPTVKPARPRAAKHRPAVHHHVVADPTTTTVHRVVVTTTVPTPPPTAPPVTHTVVTVAPPPPPPPPPATPPTTAPHYGGPSDPRASIPPPAGMNADCDGARPVPTCDVVALAAINAARRSEGLGPLSLPSNYESLPLASQLVAVTDAERASRGFPTMGVSGLLDSLALVGAEIGADPTGPGGYTWGSNISWGYESPLAADYAWMYDDGPGGDNVTCPSSGGGGCWDHRNNILAGWGGLMGAAAYDAGGTWRLALLLVNE